jgi:hypothetical protein
VNESSDPLLESWSDVLDDEVHLEGSAEGFEAERRQNMWRLGAPSEQLRQTTPERLAAWVQQLIEDRREKVRRGYRGQRAVFYLWFDAQAGQLRFNVMSDHGQPLPFGAEVRLVDDPDPQPRVLGQGEFLGAPQNVLRWPAAKSRSRQENDGKLNSKMGLLVIRGTSGAHEGP